EPSRLSGTQVDTGGGFRSAGPWRWTHRRAVASKRARGGGESRHRQAPKQAARGARTADLSRPSTRSGGRDRGHVGGSGEGQFLSRARESEEAVEVAVMKHLSRTEFVDLLDSGSALSADSVRHTETCPDCRRQLDVLRETSATAREDVGAEPSPLFWNHFAA